MAEKLKYYGRTIEDLQKLSIKEFAEITNSRARKSLKKGLREEQKKLLEKIEKFKQGKIKKPVKTHLRDMIILPQMAGVKLLVHNGKTFMPLEINEEMLGRYLGDFVLTRAKTKHSAPGIGATRSSAAVSVK